MAPKEILTYFGYQNGYDPKVLRLGNLAFDYTNPRMREPYIHEEFSEEELQKYATVDHRPTCYMTLSESRGFGFGLGLQDLLTFDATHSSGSYRLIVGQNGSELELIEPQTFFANSILKSEKARLWLQARLSVMKKTEIMKAHLGFRPKIWLLTGLYTTESATTFSIHNRSSNHELSAAVPIPDPSGLAALLQLNVGGKVKISSGSELTAGAQILTPKVWAAQWQRIDAKFVHAKNWVSEIPGQLRLINTYSLQQVRAADEVLLAELKLDEKAPAIPEQQVGESCISQSDEWWREFEEEVQDVEDDLT